MNVLNQTESILFVEKEKYDQLVSICKPWPVKKKRSFESSTNVHCTCSSTSTTINEINPTLLDNIPIIVNKTKALRINPYESSKYEKAKKTIKETISVTKSKSSVKIEVKKSKSGTGLHNPSCRLYGSQTSISKTESIMSLSEAVSNYGVPEKLNRTLRDYYRFVLRNEDDSITKRAKNDFLKSLNKFSDDTWKVVETNVEKMPKYMLALSSIRKTKTNIPITCIIYRNIEDLTLLELCKLEMFEREIWHDILKYLNKDFITILLQYDLTYRQRIYICKMLHAICNYSISRVPNVPFYRIL